MEKEVPKVLAPLNGCLITLSFLTRLPLKAFGFDKLSWRWSPAFFPLAGFILGWIAVQPLIAALKYEFKGIGFELSTPFLYVALLYWMNRMLHLDGFCDCIDGFSVMTDSPEKRLEVMKDPCVGSSAAGASVLLICGKVLMVFILVWQYGAHLANDYQLSELVSALIAVPVLARVAIVLLAFKAKYPREKGTGSVIVGNVPVYSLVIAIVSLLPLFLYVTYPVVKVMLTMTGLNILYWRRKANTLLDGVTGDVLGACCETTEFCTLFALVLMLDISVQV